MNKDTRILGKGDFTVEWTESNGNISDVRITKGMTRFRLPWYRRLLLKLLGRSHWQHVTIQRKGNLHEN